MCALELVIQMEIVLRGSVEDSSLSLFTTSLSFVLSGISSRLCEAANSFLHLLFIPSFFLDFLSITVVFSSLFSFSYCLHFFSSDICG